jgi:hypothetical protein
MFVIETSYSALILKLSGNGPAFPVLRFSPAFIPKRRIPDRQPPANSFRFGRRLDRVVRGFLKRFAPDVFRPEEISILEDALDDAWRRIENSKAPWASDDYSAVGRTILAKYIITMAKGGERDARWLADSAVLYLCQKKLTRHAPEI